MNTIKNPVRKRRAFRKRIRDFAQLPLVAKQFAWRLTAGWLWIYALAAVFRQREHLQGWEDSLFLAMNGTLIRFGFAPSSPSIFPISIKFLWLLTICAFSWVQIIGFYIYVAFFPLAFLALVLFRRRLKPHRNFRNESLKKARRDGYSAPKRTWGFPLLSLLLLWLVLYGRTSSPYPLALAMLLTALYFCSRVTRALAFAVPEDKPRWNRIEAMIARVRKFVLETIDDFKAGNIQELRHLRIVVWTATLLLRQLRTTSRLMYGKSARRKVALFVLVRFMFNLAALGGVSIFFWALAIKYSMSPSYLELSKALLASASRAIPGVPDSTTINVPATIQVLDSLTAWMVFVLYAGPVASLFPAFQKRAISQMTANYERIRIARKAIYRFTELLRTIQGLFIEHPELKGFAKNLVLLRKQGDLRSFLLTQPEFVRSLADKPGEVELYKTLGVPIPDLHDLLCELTPKPIQTTQAPTDSAASETSGPSLHVK